MLPDTTATKMSKRRPSKHAHTLSETSESESESESDSDSHLRFLCGGGSVEEASAMGAFLRLIEEEGMRRTSSKKKRENVAVKIFGGPNICHVPSLVPGLAGPTQKKFSECPRQ